MTYSEDFFNKHPNALKTKDKIPVACRVSIYGGKCKNMIRGCVECWNDAIELTARNKVTNFERIKNMSAREMATLIMCPYEGKDGFDAMKCLEPEGCLECSLKWLESEAVE